MSQEDLDVVRRSVEAFPRDVEEMLSYFDPEGELHSAIVGGGRGQRLPGPPMGWAFTVRRGKVVKAEGFLSRDEALEAVGLKE